MEKSKIIKYIRNFIIFVLLIILTFWIIFKDQNGEELVSLLKSSNWIFVFYGCLIMIGFFALEAFNIGRMLRHLGEKSSFFRNYKYALIGHFFSAITPASTGGQPMQIYFMHKDGINVGSSTLTLLLNISCVLFVTVTLAFFNLIFNYQYMTPGLWLFFAYGIIVNSVAVVLFLIAMFSEKTLNKLLNIGKALLKRFTYGRMKRVKKGQATNKRSIIARIRKRYERWLERIEGYVNKYRENAQILKNDKKIMVKSLISYYIQYTLYFSVAYFAYLALPMKEYTNNWFDITSLQSILFGIVSGVPLPGAVGVSEATYFELFKEVISPELISSFMLLVRMMNFYLFVFIAGIVVVYAMYKVSKMNKKTQK